MKLHKSPVFWCTLALALLPSSYCWLVQVEAGPVTQAAITALSGLFLLAGATAKTVASDRKIRGLRRSSVALANTLLGIAMLGACCQLLLPLLADIKTTKGWYDEVVMAVCATLAGTCFTLTTDAADIAVAMARGNDTPWWKTSVFTVSTALLTATSLTLWRSGSAAPHACTALLGAQAFVAYLRMHLAACQFAERNLRTGLPLSDRDATLPRLPAVAWAMAVAAPYVMATLSRPGLNPTSLMAYGVLLPPALKFMLLFEKHVALRWAGRAKELARIQAAPVSQAHKQLAAAARLALLAVQEFWATFIILTTPAAMMALQFLVAKGLSMDLRQADPSVGGSSRTTFVTTRLTAGLFAAAAELVPFYEEELKGVALALPLAYLASLATSAVCTAIVPVAGQLLSSPAKALRLLDGIGLACAQLLVCGARIIKAAQEAPAPKAQTEGSQQALTEVAPHRGAQRSA